MGEVENTTQKWDVTLDGRPDTIIMNWLLENDHLLKTWDLYKNGYGDYTLNIVTEDLNTASLFVPYVGKEFRL